MQNLASCSQLLRAPSALPTRWAAPWPELVGDGSITLARVAGEAASLGERPQALRTSRDRYAPVARRR